jgi:hypothetical protein
MKRLCEYPGCKTTLYDPVPLQIIHCGIHLRELRILKERLAPENLPKEDILFIFHHPKGCNRCQLAVHLGLDPTSVLGYLKRGVLKGKKDEHQGVWNIPQKEIERAIILVRNWISLYEAAKIAGIPYGVHLLNYAKRGYLGKIRTNLSGYYAIPKKSVPELKERYEKISQAMRLPKNWLKQKGWLNDGELMTSEIAKKAGVSINGVNLWIKKGRLPARKAGSYWIVLESDFHRFAQKVVNGKYLTKRRIKESLRKFLSQPNPPVQVRGKGDGKDAKKTTHLESYQP